MKCFPQQGKASLTETHAATLVWSSATGLRTGSQETWVLDLALLLTLGKSLALPVPQFSPAVPFCTVCGWKTLYESVKVRFKTH